jgi:hypothetical protein
MTQEHVDIQTLRQRLQEAKTKTLGEEMMALIRLFKHPDITWMDLLDALELTGTNAESAALNLHGLLSIPWAKRQLIFDRQFWEEALRKKGMKAQERIRDNPESKRIWDDQILKGYELEGEQRGRS